ncbi:outer membrane lipoprotein SlyB [Sphingomonas sp. SORGH_AS870]|uniref:hypothetical protein n=1 Tax=Sphingomonas sp. SORGH_AS_0870 TaxID=3041801 RepID=UPI002855CF00|nr:hypothetical protein [Sphingomonas sp. SORGH_AS_0870]MDR6145317.1 outer membrane lipoprotein SlyB [Sphingomonas sp. SORGH_AS_0870]
MKTLMTTLSAAILLTVAGPASAKGCLKGAAVGGVAGHFVGKGHAVLGAVAGCAIGHHRAKVQARKDAAAARGR